jgi:hypothetical protein
LTYRSGKRHRVQQSSKPTKSVPKLASKLQHFATTGKVPKQDLRAIDDQLNAILLDQTKRAMQLLFQLADRAPKEKKSGSAAKVCDEWANWISLLESKHGLGYSDVKFQRGASHSAILDSIIDEDTDLFSMLSAFNNSLVAKVGKSSYELTDFDEIYSSAKEILETHRNRQKIISRLVA